MPFMAGQGGSRWRMTVLAGGMVLLAASVLALLVAWRLKDLGTAANIGQIVGVALTVPTLMAALVSWWRRGRWPTAATPEQVRSAADVLAQLVADQWGEEAKVRSLNNPDPIPVRWRLTTAGLMDHPASVSASRAVKWDGTSDQIDRLAARFRMLRRRRLAVLGGPGSGKTTLAVQMVQELLRTLQPGEPVPVLVSAAEWDAESEPDMWAWMAGQLALGYPALKSPKYGGRAPRDLTAAGLILPVLDGLDEIPAVSRAAVLRALNTSLGTGQLILTCRTAEYAQAVRDAADVLTGAAVIEAEPLTPRAAAAYLTTCLRPAPSPSWQQVLGGLRTGGAAALAEVCSTPLGLWLLRSVYCQPGADPAPLADPARYPTRKALQAHLLDQLIPALIRTRPPLTDAVGAADLFRPSKHYDPDQAARWLGYLAHYLTHPQAPDGQPRTRDLAWWQFAAAVPPRARHAVRLAAGLAWLVLGLLVGLADWQSVQHASGIVDLRLYGHVPVHADLHAYMHMYLFVIVVGLLFGLAPGALGGLGLFAALDANDAPGYANLSPRGRVPLLFSMLADGLATRIGGLIPVYVWVIVFGAAVWIVPGPAAGIVGALVVMYGFGFLIVLVKWVESPASTARATSPVTTWRADRTLNLLRAAVGGLPFAIVFAILCSVGGRSGFVIVMGAVTGVVIGVWFGFGVGNHHAWLGYLFATFSLAQHKCLPRRLMAFLEDAYRLGLLRTVGPVYQFRHAELQDHLASTYQAQLRLTQP